MLEDFANFDRRSDGQFATMKRFFTEASPFTELAVCRFKSRCRKFVRAAENLRFETNYTRETIRPRHFRKRFLCDAMRSMMSRYLYVMGIYTWLIFVETMPGDLGGIQKRGAADYISGANERKISKWSKHFRCVGNRILYKICNRPPVHDVVTD